MRRVVAASLALGVLSLAVLAHASERLAVVLLVEGEPEMADGLTEIAIAHLAEQRGDLVGLRELRGRLPASVNGEKIETCLAAGRCLSELGQASGAERAVIGRLTHAPDGTWRFELGLADMRAGTIAWRAPHALPVETSALVAGIRAEIDDLMGRAVAPPPPSLPEAPAPAAAQTPAGASPEIVAQSEPAAPPAGRARRIVGWSVAGLAAASLVTAGILGHYAGLMPAGATRADAQADLERRENEATAANVLWISGGVLGAVAAGVLVWPW